MPEQYASHQFLPVQFSTKEAALFNLNLLFSVQVFEKLCSL